MEVICFLCDALNFLLAVLDDHALYLIMIIIFSYQRRDMLERLLSEVMGRGQRVIVIDDGSDFKLDYVEWISMPHGGKKGFWKNWNKAFNLFNESGDDFVLFIPDDVKNIDFEKIDSYRDQLVKQRYIFNVLTDQRKRCWNRKPRGDSA